MICYDECCGAHQQQVINIDNIVGAHYLPAHNTSPTTMLNKLVSNSHMVMQV